jgi:hypothetical protein
MVCPGNGLQSGHQHGPRRGGAAQSAAERAADPYRADAAQRGALQGRKSCHPKQRRVPLSDRWRTETAEVMAASTTDDVARELAALAELDRTALLERWRRAFGRDAPPRLSRALMQKAIAYDLQVEAFGGLPSRTRRALRAAAKADRKSALSNLPSRGTRLIREWHGTVHEVEVLEDGYYWRGARHRSLSAIARAITGTRWSGPRFFGLLAQP